MDNNVYINKHKTLEEEIKKFKYMKENLHKNLELFEKYFYVLWD